jgi:hypothetical protein
LGSKILQMASSVKKFKYAIKHSTDNPIYFNKNIIEYTRTNKWMKNSTTDFKIDFIEEGFFKVFVKLMKG